MTPFRDPTASEWDALVIAAVNARSHAYAPYSRFDVGAAVLAESGRMFAGCNVENASFGATLCAERTAVCTAVSAGERRLIACVIVTAGPEPASPCGMCRQVLAEFSDRMVVMLVSASNDARELVSLADLLPRAFVKSALENRELRSNLGFGGLGPQRKQ
jgi:cytidine deaminase